MSVKLKESDAITGTGAGRPDYYMELIKTLFGYVPEPDETHLWAVIIATGSPGLYNFTRGPITVAEGWVELVDAFTGILGIVADVNEDYILKEIWISFDQPMQFQMYQDAIGDVSCEGIIPAFTTSPWSGLPIGWTRSQCEPLTAISKTTLRVRNLGTQDAIGKCWVAGFRRPRQYTWF